MPTISYFYGIYIRLYANEHNPPHFHVKYNEYAASIDIKTGEIKDGKLPLKARALAGIGDLCIKKN